MPIQSGVGGAGKLYTSKTIYAPAYKQRFRDQTLITRLTNSDWKGTFKGTGTEIKVPCLPIIHTKSRRKGETVKYQTPQNWEETFVIKRERDFAFKVTDEDRIFSYLGVDEPFVAEGLRQMAEDVDIEFFADIYSKCHLKNQGNAAGYRSNGFTLGEATAPLFVYESREDKNADATAGRKKAVATKAVTSMMNTLREQPGGMDTKPWAVIPTIIGDVLQNSPLAKANQMADSASVLRKSIQYLGEISGGTIWVCNHLPIIRGDGTLPDRYVCLFGDTSAVTFADEARIGETLRDKDEYGNFHRNLMIYDWFVRYPERLGSAILAVA